MRCPRYVLQAGRDNAPCHLWRLVPRPDVLRRRRRRAGSASCYKWTCLVVLERYSCDTWGLPYPYAHQRTNSAGQSCREAPAWCRLVMDGWVVTNLTGACYVER